MLDKGFFFNLCRSVAYGSYFFLQLDFSLFLSVCVSSGFLQPFFLFVCPFCPILVHLFYFIFITFKIPAHILMREGQNRERETERGEGRKRKEGKEGGGGMEGQKKERV